MKKDFKRFYALVRMGEKLRFPCSNPMAANAAVISLQNRLNRVPTGIAHLRRIAYQARFDGWEIV